MIVLPYAIIVSIIACCLNRKFNINDKKQIKIKRIFAWSTFFLMLFCVCCVAVLLGYNFNTRAIIRFATENIIAIKNHYILGKGLFITLFLSIITFAYNYWEAKIRAKKLAQEAESVNYEVDNQPEEKPFWEKYRLLEALCYIGISTITYIIASSIFLKFIAFVAKNYVRFNM